MNFSVHIITKIWKDRIQVAEISYKKGGNRQGKSSTILLIEDSRLNKYVK